jgi:hypothetical protein
VKSEVVVLAFEGEAVAEAGNLDAGDALVDFEELLVRFLAGSSLGFKFVDSTEDLGALDLSVHVAENPDVGADRARFADYTALLVAGSLHGERLYLACPSFALALRHIP